MQTYPMPHATPLLRRLDPTPRTMPEPFGQCRLASAVDGAAVAVDAAGAAASEPVKIAPISTASSIGEPQAAADHLRNRLDGRWAVFQGAPEVARLEWAAREGEIATSGWPV